MTYIQALYRESSITFVYYSPDGISLKLTSFLEHASLEKRKFARKLIADGELYETDKCLEFLAILQHINLKMLPEEVYLKILQEKVDAMRLKIS